jgi:hypothetical protein
MNYASVITLGVVFLSLLSVHDIAMNWSLTKVAFTRVWYFLGGRRHYKGPVSNLPASHNDLEIHDTDSKESDPKEDVKEDTKV